MKPTYRLNYSLMACVALICASCSEEKITDVDPEETSLPEWYYAGGELGTTFLSTTNVFEQPAPARRAGG